jgi:hypothetical protein
VICKPPPAEAVQFIDNSFNPPHVRLCMQR